MKDQPNTPAKMGPWGAVAAFAVLVLILLGFVWGVAAAIKWV
jgi:hypothetical protein